MALRRERKTKRLWFGEDWIDVRTERMYRDTVEAQRAAAAKVSASRGKDRAAAAQVDFDISAFNLSLLTRMIVAWSEDMPINEETVQEMPDKTIQQVLSVILGTEPEEQKAPLENSSTSASASPDESSSSEEKALTGPAR